MSATGALRGPRFFYLVEDKMTYAELLKKLNEMTAEQLASEAIYQDTNNGEFMGIVDVCLNPSYDYGADDDSQPVVRIQQ